MIHWLAWFYWDPPKTLFTIPWIDRPIAWYGVLFVLGFIVGCFLLAPFFTQFLRQLKTLSNLDVLNWPSLLQALSSPSKHPIAEKIYQELSLVTKNQLDSWNAGQIRNSALEKEILQTINRLLHDSSLNRQELEGVFSGAIATVKQTSWFLVDRICWFTMIGTLIGARLGAVFFYDWDYFSQHPTKIFQIWEGGLASHGGAIGILIALSFYTLYIRKWIPDLRLLNILDGLSIPIPLAGCLIRLGNFINQEILGTPTSLPWGVILGHPADGSLPIPRHPVQLYEALAYLTIFFFLYGLWKRQGTRLPTGLLAGLFLTLAFTSRLILEFWKVNQEAVVDLSFFQMGQVLSLPFIAIGVGLVYWSWRRSSRSRLLT
jgi:prolipoprotein diacylglyceryl transferase